MGRQFVKQPNGKYAIWSTIINDFVYKDLTKEEYINIRISEVAENTKKELERVFEENNSIYFKDYNECLRIIKNEQF